MLVASGYINDAMEHPVELTRNWWTLLVRGIVAVIFGILAIANPKTTLTVLLLFAAAYVIVDGILSILASLTAAERGRGWGWLLVSGILGVAIGVAMFVWPDVTALVLLYLFVAWLLVIGVMQLVAGIRMRRLISGALWIALAGVLSIVLGFYILANPEAGLIGLLWIIGIYAILFGAMMIMASLQLRRWYRNGHTPAAAHN